MGRTVSTVAFFGPAGTFTEEALLTQPDLSAAVLSPKADIASVLEAVASGEVDLGFVPLENAIEGTVTATMDTLIFDVDLLIEREVVLDIHLHLMAKPGTALEDVTTVASYPHALAQCRRFLSEQLPSAERVAATSTADAARRVGEAGGPGDAAVAPRLAAELYGLDIIASDVEDHEENQTRFISVVADGIPQATGSDRTMIVCFQDADRPGSLYGILSMFATRDVNLTNLQSRPTKRGLGEYCFIIELEGHLSDPVVRDCLRDLRAHLADIKFLGSYPVAGELAPGAGTAIAASRRSADEWIAGLEEHLGR